MNAKEQLIEWLDHTKWYASIDLKSQITTRSIDDPEDKDTHQITLYTNKNSYRITAGGGSDYLGCIMNARDPLPGETWTRGRDLADGKLNNDTRRKILTDIVACELVEGNG